MRIAWILLVLLLLPLLPISHGLVINEVMYHTNITVCEDDAYCEWIELYNNGIDTINLGNFTVCNKSLQKGYIDKLTGNTFLDTTFELQPNQFAIVTDGGSGTLVYNNFTVSNSSVALHTNVSTICGQLDNGGAIIEITNGTIFIEASYDGSLANGNGKRSALFQTAMKHFLSALHLQDF